MESTLRRLIEVYQRERVLYGEILDRVHRQRELISAEASYAEINSELARKRELLLEIESLEAGIQQDRVVWQRRRHELDGKQAKSLIGLLSDVTGLVETIISRERENEVLLTSRRRSGPRAPVNQREAAERYQAQNSVGVER